MKLGSTEKIKVTATNAEAEAEAKDSGPPLQHMPKRPYIKPDFKMDRRIFSRVLNIPVTAAKC